MIYLIILSFSNFYRTPEYFSNPETALTNDWTLVSTILAVDRNSPLERVTAMHKIGEAIKRSLRPLSSSWINAIGFQLFPSTVMKNTVYETYNRHSVVFANVPGPPVS